MKVQNDWVLENIKNEIKHQDLKLEFISRSLGISVGEFSKILNGERKNYYKYVYQLADILQVGFLQLVQNNRPASQKTGNMDNHDMLSSMIDQARQTIHANEKTIKTLEEILRIEREAKEIYKLKYKYYKQKHLETEKRNSDETDQS